MEYILQSDEKFIERLKSTLNILMSVVNIFNSNPIHVRIEQNIAKGCFHNSNMKSILIVDREWEAKSSFLQNVFKRSTESHACLSLQTHKTCVVWCGTGHEEFSVCDHVVLPCLSPTQSEGKGFPCSVWPVPASAQTQSSWCTCTWGLSWWYKWPLCFVKCSCKM